MMDAKDSTLAARDDDAKLGSIGICNDGFTASLHGTFLRWYLAVHLFCCTLPWWRAASVYLQLQLQHTVTQTCAVRQVRPFVSITAKQLARHSSL